MAAEHNDWEPLVTENLALVHACANRFRGRGAEYEELYSAGCVGLVKAAKGFDPGRGFAFSTYAVPVILGEIRRVFRDGGAIKVGRTLKEKARRAMQEDIKSEFGEFGFEVINLSIESINVPDEDLNKLNDILHKKAEYEQLGDTVYRTTRGYDVLEGAANNNGGVGTMMGLGMGMNMAGQATNGTQIIPPSQPNAAPAAPAAAATIRCPKCGKEISADSKFCPDCGTKIIRECPNCHAPVTPGTKFCSNCGAKLVD